MIRMYRFECPAACPCCRVYAQVVKNRFEGDLGVMTLKFNKDAQSFSTVARFKDYAALAAATSPSRNEEKQTNHSGS